MRKNNNYEVSDRINIYYQSSEFTPVIDEFMEYIQNETLALNIVSKEVTNMEDISVNGINVLVSIEKNNK